MCVACILLLCLSCFFFQSKCLNPDTCYKMNAPQGYYTKQKRLITNG
ncbi:unnamed protein product [Nyctereutes procyonoides]|uniref:(raccoon dog) hypothetical protein n=1 Tax=Nyctereutes procyonoides TaxID=34880 RepID=A0A811ZB99_NYCPR|nr:unnamed protein product [Nyctereutes procyonoides]